jgi:DNA repair protein RecO (recombination protein O)
LATRSVCSTLGLVLRAQPYRDSDLIVTLFTQELGKISALARGGRRSQKRFAGALGQLVVSTFEVSRSPRAELWTLEASTVERDWMDLSLDVASVAHASYGLELVRELLPSETPEPEVLALMVALWDSLRSGASAAALRYVELSLLSVAGTPPSLDSCAACGVSLDDERARDPSCLFDPARGGAICSTCAPHSRGAGARPLGASARRYLSRLAQATSVAEARQIEADAPLDAVDRVSTREAMLAMIHVLVPHPLKTVEFIAKLSRPIGLPEE